MSDPTTPPPVPAGFAPLRIPGWEDFDPARARGGGLRGHWRGFTTAVRIGWATEANWTDPLLFFIYSVAKPVSAALILVVMLEVIGGATSRQYRSFVVVGSALVRLVAAGGTCSEVVERVRGAAARLAAAMSGEAPA